jgi:hypothetical protein
MMADVVAFTVTDYVTQLITVVACFPGQPPVQVTVPFLEPQDQERTGQYL